MLVVLFFASYIIEDNYNNIITLLILIILGIVSYIVISYLINKKKLKEIQSVISKYYKATKNS